MTTSHDQENVFEQVTRVIRWELDAQAGVRRPSSDLPPLLADSLLDFFDISLKPGVELPDGPH